MTDYIIKNGLIYSQDLKTVLGVDTRSLEFSGKIPYGAKFIDDEVFTQCPYINMDLPDSIEKLGNALFEDSLELKSVKLPAFIKDLPPYLFSGCKSLTKVYMPNVLNGFSQGLFKNCSSLTEIPFRAGIKKLPQSVFESCSSLTALVIPSTVEVIESRAFAYCKNLLSLVLPESLKEIHEDAFLACDSIQNIRISSENENFYIGQDSCLYERAKGDMPYDKLLLKVSKAKQEAISFYKENVDDEIDLFFTNEDIDEEDDTFSGEIELREDEFMDNSMDLEEMTLQDMDLENKNIQVLLDSAIFNKILDFSSEITSNNNRILFVISEVLINNEDGDNDFTSKLINCSSKIARIQEIKKVVFLYGLPYENEDFIRFLTNSVENKDVIFACKAKSPSDLSVYGKRLCQAAQISLEKDFLLNQRKKISIKNNDLIKIVIQDLK